MSQIAIIGVNPSRGNKLLLLPELRDESQQNKSHTHHSETKAWAVTIGAVNAIFDLFVPAAEPVEPAVESVICTWRMKNEGSIAGEISYSVLELDSFGDILREFLKPSISAPILEITDLSLFLTGWMVEIKNPVADEQSDILRMVANSTVFYKEEEVVVSGNSTKYVFGNWGSISTEIEQTICAEVGGGAKTGIVKPGECACVDIKCDPEMEASGIVSDPTCTCEGEITINRTPGTYYFAVKTWGEGEKEPSLEEELALAGFGGLGGSRMFNLLKCLFPRLLTKNATPRIVGNMTPRINCIKEWS